MISRAPSRISAIGRPLCRKPPANTPSTITATSLSPVPTISMMLCTSTRVALTGGLRNCARTACCEPQECNAKAPLIAYQAEFLDTQTARQFETEVADLQGTVPGVRWV